MKEYHIFFTSMFSQRTLRPLQNGVVYSSPSVILYSPLLGSADGGKSLFTIKTSETGTRSVPRSTRHQLGFPVFVRVQLPFASNSGLRFPSTAFSAPLESFCLDDCSAVFLRARFSVNMNLNKLTIITIKKKKNRQYKRWRGKLLLLVVL